MKKRHILLMLGLLLIVLSSSRIFWMELFRDQKQRPVENGQLDLRNWDAEDGEVLLLDGDWEFYPSSLLMDEERQPGLGNAAPQLIQVPGKWNEVLHSPYGFATYRLRVLVNPEKKDLNYSIRVPSVRSSSEVYVNGRLLAKSGKVAKHQEEYIAKNLPYSTTFTADDKGVIEIVIQAANYADIRGSGIIRSIKFGTEEAIAKEMKLSSSMQLLTAIMFLIHSVYSLILFFLGNREKKLLFFSLLTLCVALGNLFSNDEKLFHQVFYIGYEWDFRLANAAVLIGCYALLECTDHRLLPYWRKIYRIYTVSTLGIAGITLLLTPPQVIMIFPVYFVLVGVAVVITGIAIMQKFIKDIKANLLLLFSLTALIHHFIWAIGWRENGISVAHYPFDLFISIACFASVWFKDYFKMHADTRELAAALQRMNDHKDQFLANTSHEFKNPLHGILNMSQTVLKRERDMLQERSVKELETILSVGRRMTLILNDLLDVMSLQEGNPRLQKKVIAIQPIITGVLDMLHFMVEFKPVKIVNQISEDFPPVYADENRVVQIVFNLLHNAVKYTNEGQITIRGFVKEGRGFIVIADTGVGMDRAMLKRLFNPYEQANSGKTMIEGGFGLGLSISRQLVELHGGELEVSSALGEGSTFTFSLKLASVKEKEAGDVSGSFEQSVPIQEKTSLDWTKLDISPVVKRPPLGDTALNRPVILIVDDDPVNLQVLEAILPPEEYDVTMVTSGKEALAILGEKEWDLVISDVMMPQMSGYELTQIIRKRFSLTELPILLLTARSRAEDIQSGFLAGANDYVTKPVEALEIRSRIEALAMIKQVVREQLQLESAWLQAQIQPHFLFNTLNAVTALSEIDLDKMRDLLDHFSHYLRNKFQFQHMDALIPVEEELSIVRSYLYIEQVRFQDRLQVVWEIDEYNDLKIPFLTIQPLVENAIRHGIMKRISGGKIMIRISQNEKQVDISVEDDGVGMEDDKLRQIMDRKKSGQSGVGLINTDMRLKRHFGRGLHIQSTPGLGTKVSFTVSNQHLQTSTEIHQES
ncbi:histidine kinase [Bacillus sp. VT-16-64]|uniref:hybrid sensor histidine kinase/response regulator n=1 Tax=Siminovitchia sp. FSL W7-1587 TaxID=2954699 RepID=UPI00097D9299|nr:histidine kinase [Bacillus sp. VT-16-64]